jgi:hypothetical protein
MEYGHPVVKSDKWGDFIINLPVFDGYYPSGYYKYPKKGDYYLRDDGQLWKCYKGYIVRRYPIYMRMNNG